MSIFQTFQAYIEVLCIKNKKTLHTVNNRKTFFRMDGEEDTAAISGTAASPMVVITSFAGSGKEGTQVFIASNLWFLSHVPSGKINQANEIERAQNEAFDLLMQFCNRIERDYESADTCAFMQSLQNFSFQPVGPVNQYEFGWELTVRFGTDTPDYNAANWS